uniref:SFRICE_028129 n=1 Tax=Spodoptera frugiperda TaxID=7108 RepID=A0A2H1WFB7_SPOFR
MAVTFGVARHAVHDIMVDGAGAGGGAGGAGGVADTTHHSRGIGKIGKGGYWASGNLTHICEQRKRCLTSVFSEAVVSLQSSRHMALPHLNLKCDAAVHGRARAGTGGLGRDVTRRAPCLHLQYTITERL